MPRNRKFNQRTIKAFRARHANHSTGDGRYAGPSSGSGMLETAESGGETAATARLAAGGVESGAHSRGIEERRPLSDPSHTRRDIRCFLQAGLRHITGDTEVGGEKLADKLPQFWQELLKIMAAPGNERAKITAAREMRYVAAAQVHYDLNLADELYAYLTRDENALPDPNVVDGRSEEVSEPAAAEHVPGSRYHNISDEAALALHRAIEEMAG